MIDVVFKLALIDNVIDLLSHALNSAVFSELAVNKLVEAARSERKHLVDLLAAVRNDVFKPEGAELVPLVFDSSQGYAFAARGFSKQ